MYKRVLIVLLFVLLYFTMPSQSLEFVYNNNLLTNNAVVTVTDFTQDDEIGVEMTFKPILQNKTNNPLKIVVRKEEISIPQGSINTFCTGTGCFTGTASSEYTIDANSNDPYFYCSFSPVMTSTATIKYTASVVGTFNDNISVTVNYQYVPAGIETLGFRRMIVILEKGTFTIQYENHSDSYLQIFDIAARKIQNYTLPASANSFQFDSMLQKGIYLLVFSDRTGNRFTKKIMVHS